MSTVTQAISLEPRRKFMRKSICIVLVALPLLILCCSQAARAHQASKQDRLSKLQRAAAYVSARDFARAETELVSILNLNPKEALALNLMGIVRAEQGRTNEAESLFKQALAASPRLAGAHVNLGLLYISQNNLGQAVNELEQALLIDASRNDATTGLVAALRRLAAAAVAAGEREKALAHLLRARTLVPSDPDVLFEFAMTALGLSLYEDAQKALVRALEIQPDEPKFIYALARARLATGEIAQAESLFRRYVELRPQDATGHYGLGYTLTLLKHGAEAARSFERSLELRPEQTESQYQLGLLAYAEGDLDRAAAWYEKVLSRHPGHAGALLGRGLIHFNRKEYELAQNDLERAIAAEPSLAKAHYHLGLTHARRGNKQLATVELELATRLEREQKEKGRVMLRLLENESQGHQPSGPVKP
jgi:tetratricopeptide (TPR) repeat protein